jgi:hypothetical protein
MTETNDERFAAMDIKTLTVVRFPAGDWSGGGRPSDPDYAQCEVYLIQAESFEKAKKKAQSVRASLVKKGLSLPSQTTPYIHHQ